MLVFSYKLDVFYNYILSKAKCCLKPVSFIDRKIGRDMDNHKSDKDIQQSDDKVSKSSHKSNTQDSQNNQDSTSNAFNFSSFGQQYLDQLNQVNQLNQSLFDQSNQASNPFEANMKLWQTMNSTSEHKHGGHVFRMYTNMKPTK